MRWFLLSCCVVLMAGCTGSRTRSAYTPPEIPIPEPEIILPGEQECPGWFKATNAETGPYLGRDLVRGRVFLQPGEHIVFRADDNFEDKHFSALVGIPRLNALMFWNIPRVTSAGLAALPDDQGIRHLGLVGPCCSAASIQVVARWNTLKELYLHELSIHLQDDDLWPLKRLPLESLSVNQCWGLDGSFLRHMPPTITNLQIFQYASNIDDELVRMLPDMLDYLPNLPALDVITLDDIQFAAMPDLAPLARQKSLSGFRIQGCHPTLDWGGGSGRVFQQMNLKKLDLAGSELDDEGLEATLAGLELEGLDVSYNQISASLAGLTRMKSLRRLALMETKCDDTTFLKFAELPNLKAIWIPTHISQDAVDEFKELRPDVSVATEYAD